MIAQVLNDFCVQFPDGKILKGTKEPKKRGVAFVLTEYVQAEGTRSSHKMSTDGHDLISKSFQLEL